MKILIIRFSSLGDIVLTQPIVQKLYEVYPEAEFYYLTKEQYKDIPAHFGIPLTVISSSDLRMKYSGLSGKKFDYVFDLQNKLNSFWVKTFCIRAKSFTYDKQRKLRQRIVAHKTDQSIDSTLDLYRSALLKAAHKTDKPELEQRLDNPKLLLSQNGINEMQKRIVIPDGKKLIALFPGATHYTKRYPREYCVRMIQMASPDYHFLLLGSKAETSLTGRIHNDATHRTTDYGGQFNLKELMEVIALSDAVISNDSGPMHITAAFGKTQIAIFGSTHPSLGFQPLNDKAYIICSDVRCQPCSLHGSKNCPRKHFACMLSIDPQHILDELQKII